MLKTFKFLTIIFSCGLLFGAIAELVKAQDLGVRVPIKSVARQPTTGGTGTRKPPRQQVKIQKVTVTQTVIVPKIVSKIVNVKTSNLVVSSESGAKVILKSLVKGGKPIPKEIPKDDPENKSVEFESLAPGKYIVTASLDGYKTQETDVTILPQKTIGITLELEPFYYQLTIETNIDEGEVRFARAKLDKINPDGSLKTTEPGDYCIVKIKDKKAVINKLQKGYYNIDISPKAVEYQPVLTAVSIPTENPDDKDAEFDETQNYGIDLVKKISTQTFASAWVNDDWVLPNGWKLQDRRMKTTGSAGIALPRNEQYRYYTNFEMISDVILTDGKTIGFALRALDTQNYYLVQIAGAKASESLIATGFIVKDGKPTLLFSNPIDNFSKTVQAKKSFRVTIKGEEKDEEKGKEKGKYNIFKIYIDDSQNGDRLEVGNMIDRDNTFRKGAVGIVGRDGANSEIGLFQVCANSCPKN